MSEEKARVSGDSPRAPMLPIVNPAVEKPKSAADGIPAVVYVV